MQTELSAEILEKADKYLTQLFAETSVSRVLLISPPDADIEMFNYEMANRGRYWNYPPYGLGVIASHLREAGIDVHILNLNNEVLKACRLSESEKEFKYDEVWQKTLWREIDSFQPNIIGVTCMFTMSHRSIVNLCEEIKSKRPEMPLALGGVHITNAFTHETTSAEIMSDLRNVDLFFLYEAELAFIRFVKVINGELPVDSLLQVYFNTSEDGIYFSKREIPSESDMNVIPAIDLMAPDEISLNGKIGGFYSLKEAETKFFTALANRGCRGQCTFCSVRSFNGKGVRHRQVDSIIDELLLLQDKYGIGHIMWLDDDFLYDQKNILNLLNRMVERNVRITWDCTNGVIASSCTDEVIAAAAESGCIGLTIGVESGSPEMLRKVRKPGNTEVFRRAAEVLRRHESINARVFLMVGMPDETYGMIQDTIDLALEIDLDWYNITVFQPLPNTALMVKMERGGKMDKVKYDEVRYSSGPYGKIREKANKKSLCYSSGIDIFKSASPDDIPKKSQMNDIWFYMNYLLNFKRLYKEHRPLKLQQQLKYIENITTLVAPDDAFAMYFCGYLQSKVHGEADRGLVERLKRTLQTVEYWSKLFGDFNMSASHLEDSFFPNEKEAVQ